MRNPALVLLLASAASAQVWQTLPAPTVYALAYDSDRHRVVAVTSLPNGDFGTMEWNGSGWLRTPATGRFPAIPTLVFPLLCYDPARHQTVLVHVGSTWTYDGVAWRQYAGVGPPPVTAMDKSAAYDFQRQVLVHYDASTSTTWEWDGVQWRAIAAPIGIGLVFGALAYDPVRGQVVAFCNSPSAATFAFDGATWTQIPGTPPALFPNQGGAVATDFLRNRVLVYGGFTNGSLGTVLAWDGTSWQILASGPASSFPSLAPDGNGGFLAFTGETWRFDGVATFTPLEGLAGTVSAMVLDPSRNLDVAVQFSNPPVTWEWDGSRWFDRGTSPGVPSLTAVVCDEARGAVLAVERNLSLPFTRTYRWTGAVWQLLQPAYQPGFQPQPCLAYDPTRQVVVMFSGGTHEWNGVDWRLIQTATHPPVIQAASAFDPALQRVIMITQNYSLRVAQEWQWDGLDWSQTSTTGVPVLPVGLFDFTRLLQDQRSGNLVYLAATGTWERVAGAWMPRGSGLQSPMSTATDPASGLVRNWGNGAWSLFRPDFGAGTAYGSGCGTAVLLPVGRPTLFESRFRFDFGHVPPNALVALYGDWHAASVPLPGGCTLLLAQPQPLGSMLANSTGFASFLLALPRSTAVLGLDLYCQGLALDPAGPLFGIVSLTGGVRVHVGD